MKKVILGISSLLFLSSFTCGAVLSLSPSEGKIPENCIQAFNVNLRMSAGEQAITSDLVVSSNMEFVEFKNGDMFKYFAPVNNEGDIVRIMLFNEWGGEIQDGGLVGTLYYKTTDVVDPYIDFVFYEKGNTTDTNINIAGRDILDHVENGKYYISSGMVCENPVIEVLKPSDVDEMDEFLKKFEADHRMEKLLFFLNTYKWYLVGIILLIVLIILASHKLPKKG